MSAIVKYIRDWYSVQIDHLDLRDFADKELLFKNYGTFDFTEIQKDDYQEYKPKGFVFLLDHHYYFLFEGGHVQEDLFRIAASTIDNKLLEHMKMNVLNANATQYIKVKFLYDEKEQSVQFQEQETKTEQIFLKYQKLHVVYYMPNHNQSQFGKDYQHDIEYHQSFDGNKYNAAIQGTELNKIRKDFEEKDLNKPVPKKMVL